MAYSGMYDPARPGELLREYMGATPVQTLANHIGVARATISRILHGHTAVTAEMSIKLGQALGLSDEFFAGVQLKRDMWEASQGKRKVVRPIPRALRVPGFEATSLH